MRPSTVAEACRRVKAGEDWAFTISNFLQAFYAADAASRSAMLEEEPARFKNQRYDALVGGIVEYLYKHYAPGRAPTWVKARYRYLARPVFIGGNGSAGMREYLTFSSPSEFKSRNLMVGEDPLRRAITPNSAASIE